MIIKLKSNEELARVRTGWMFAWWPVFTNDGYWVWLRKVWREAYLLHNPLYQEVLQYKYYIKGGPHV